MSDLLLLSGGIDSICLAAWQRPDRCLTIDYGQQAAIAEVRAASAACKALDIEHDLLTIPMRKLGSGIMAGNHHNTASPHPEFWPFRNQFLITVGAMYAMRFGFSRVLIGTVKSDHRHADGTAEFVDRISQLIQHQEGGIVVGAPAMHLSSAELIQASEVPHAVLGWAHSCHAEVLACGNCPGCHKHSEAMQAIGWNR